MKKMLKSLLTTLILIICITVITSCACNPEVSKSYSREINNNEVIVEKSSASKYFGFAIRPQIDVENLYITIGFYDKNNYPVCARTKLIGTVNKGQEYHIEFINSDFTLKEFLAISKSKYLSADATLWVKQETKGICFKHQYDDGFISKIPTCLLSGQKTYTCSICGYKKTKILTHTGQHDWVENKYSEMKCICTLCCCSANSKNV